MPDMAKQKEQLSTVYDRNKYVIEYTKRRANGECELCNEPGPFRNKFGEVYLEVHHITWLSKGGSDTVDNTVALCPNCHKELSVGTKFCGYCGVSINY